MYCSNCGEPYSARDNFCRNCGMPFHSAEVPAVGSSLLPATWRQMKPALWQGITALAVGTALELLRREVQRRLSAPLAPAKPRVREVPMGTSAIGPPEEEAGSMTFIETFIFRRIRIRR